MIKPIILGVSLVAVMIVQPIKIEGESRVEIPEPTPIVEETPKTIPELVNIYSKKYNVSAKKMMDTMRCENHEFDPTKQSGLHYNRDHPEWGVKKGEREKSYGLVQIHLPAHPEVTYEQATNPEFAIEFMAKKFSQGHGYEWSCY